MDYRSITAQDVLIDMLVGDGDATRAKRGVIMNSASLYFGVYSDSKNA
jgi:hypothetical protein